MFNWWRKLLGQHVCEEFTRWQVKRSYQTVSLPLLGIHNESPEVIAEYVRRGVYNVKWQERECTVCGKVQREQLPLF